MDVAVASGFKHQEYLGMIFRTSLGKTPAAYRREIRGRAGKTRSWSSEKGCCQGRRAEEDCWQKGRREEIRRSPRQARSRPSEKGRCQSRRAEEGRWQKGCREEIHCFSRQARSRPSEESCRCRGRCSSQAGTRSSA